MSVRRVISTLGLVTVLAAAMVIMTSAASVARAQSPNQSDEAAVRGGPVLDHFWCYRTTSTPVAEVVGLHDQFHDQPINVTVGKPKVFCNPARKKHGDRVFEILHPEAHLLFYKIGVAQAITRQVRVKNQFGRKVLDVFEPAVRLAVPTKKNDHPAPQGLDHFQCYRVQGDRIDVTVGLQDQFNTQDDITVGKPTLLCNPARKLHNGQFFPALHPKAHLVCYKITPLAFERDVDTVNQFRAEKITLGNSVLLCAPSKKRELD